MAAESAACRCLSAQHPNLLQRVLTMHLLMLNRPRPRRPLMCSGSGTALRRDLLQTLRGLRPYIAFPLHLGGTAGPLGGAGGWRGGHTMRSVQGTLRSHGARGAIQMQSVIIFPGLKQRPEKG